LLSNLKQCSGQGFPQLQQNDERHDHRILNKGSKWKQIINLGFL